MMDYERKSRVLVWVTAASVFVVFVAIWLAARPAFRQWKCEKLSGQQMMHETLALVRDLAYQLNTEPDYRAPEDSILRHYPPLRPSEAAWLAEHCYLGEPR